MGSCWCTCPICDKDMEDCECLSDEELEAADFFEYKEAKWEDFRGAIIFWLIVVGIVLFGIVPWVVGVIAILF